MKHISDYLYYGIEYKVRNNINSVQSRWKNSDYSYCKRHFVSVNDVNNEWHEKLCKKEAFSSGRIGFFELSAMRNREFEKRKNYSGIMHSLSDCAGFFPEDTSLLDKFLDIMKSSIGQLDFLLASGEPFENYFIDKYSDNKILVTPTFELASPWKLYEQSGISEVWTSALYGKKVLVIHPFEDSIKKQYQKREYIFPGSNILPEFDLITYKPLVTIGDMSDERFKDWFEALTFMEKQISCISFDIALIACGAYGFPLAAYIGSLGKTAIHMGGSLQILFGILGKRWDGSRFGGIEHMDYSLKRFYSDAWIYPSESETPKASANVEYGPYWK